ncbi:MAG: hypothetical protein WKF87_11165 [Chryseolinea sp.]
MIKCKSFALAILLAVLSSPLIAQNFEGKIIYSVTYKSKMPNVTDEQFGLMLGTKHEYFIKEGNYKTVTNGTFFLWQVFVNKDGKLYNKMANSESLLYNDVTVAINKLIKSEKNENVVTILGYPCNELIFSSENSQEKYFYNAALKLDNSYYTNHKLGNWDEFTKQANAVPLKFNITTLQFIMDATAIEILPMKLDDKLFELPAGSKAEKSPF